MNTSPLIITIGLFFLLALVIMGALFRTASASLFSKIAILLVLLILTCALAYTLPDAYGYPVETTMESLPQKAELLAFHPYNDEKSVDLWLMPDGAPQPRAYSIPMTDELKETLRQAKSKLAQGARAELAKKGKAGKPRPPGYIDKDGGKAPYELLPDAFNLPKKD
jgi:hypothetical protein